MARKVWILETYTAKPLSMVSERKLDINESRKINEQYGKHLTNPGDNAYIFEGPCAFFGKDEVNENNRWYTSEDYLSHLPYLQEQIEANSLLGSSDHNQEYLVSMKDVSHKINKLWYDKELDQVWIQIELIPTINGNGLDLMAIVDKKVPLYVSSRATGYMEKDDGGQITLDTIYTYDVVYRPGFKNAKLKRLTQKVTNIGKGVEVYEWVEPSNTVVEENTLINKEQPNIKMAEFVTKEDFNKAIADVMGAIKSLPTSVSESKVIAPISPNLDMHIKKSIKNVLGKKPVKVNESEEPTEKVETTPTYEPGASLTVDWDGKTPVTIEAVEGDKITIKRSDAEDGRIVVSSTELEKMVVADDTSEAAGDIIGGESKLDILKSVANYDSEEQLVAAADKLSTEDAQWIYETLEDFGGLNYGDYYTLDDPFSDEDMDKLKALVASLGLTGVSESKASPKILKTRKNKAIRTVTEVCESLIKEMAQMRKEMERVERIAKSSKTSAKRANESQSLISKQVARLEDMSEAINVAHISLSKRTESIKNKIKTLDVSESVKNLEQYAVTSQKYISRLEESLDENSDMTNELVEKVEDIIPEVVYQLVAEEGFELPEGFETAMDYLKSLFVLGELIETKDGVEIKTKLTEKEIKKILGKAYKAILKEEPKEEEPEETAETVVESALNKRRKSIVSTYEAKYPFLSKLASSTLDKFSKLSDANKKRVCEGLENKKSVVDSAILGRMAAIEKDDKMNLLFGTIPAEMQPVYESLSPNQKNAIKAAFRQKNIVNVDEAVAFWYNVELPQAINESVQHGRKKVVIDEHLGYDIGQYF